MFCLIFIGPGGEHMAADDLIQHLMPAWTPLKRLVSIACGFWLLCWGGLILVGWNLRWTAAALGGFLILVTVLVHLSGMFSSPHGVAVGCQWMWDILQRSNLAKNLCLLGVCFHLLHHRLGKYSLQAVIVARS